jgi:hypothetical protein
VGGMLVSTLPQSEGVLSIPQGYFGHCPGLVRLLRRLTMLNMYILYMLLGGECMPVSTLPQRKVFLSIPQGYWRSLSWSVVRLAPAG